MRDVSFKVTTRRAAIARAELTASPQTIQVIREGKVPKGDPLPIAKVAAVNAAKRTTEWIPYCHPIPIEYVGVDFELHPDRIVVEVEVVSIAKTGVEMEAMTAAAAAALTLYDMLKMIDDDMEIVGVKLLQKLGGKSDHLISGDWTGVVLSVSGEPDDHSIALADGLTSRGAKHVGRIVAQDDEQAFAAALGEAVGHGVDVVLVTSTRYLSVVDRMIEHPLLGVVSAIRSYQQGRVPTSMIHDVAAGLVGSSVVATLPGSPELASDTLNALFPGVLHVKSLLLGDPKG